MANKRIKSSIDERLKQARARREKRKTLINSIVDNPIGTEESKQDSVMR